MHPPHPLTGVKQHNSPAQPYWLLRFLKWITIPSFIHSYVAIFIILFMSRLLPIWYCTALVLSSPPPGLTISTVVAPTIWFRVSLVLLPSLAENKNWLRGLIQNLNLKPLWFKSRIIPQTSDTVWSRWRERKSVIWTEQRTSLFMGVSHIHKLPKCSQ